MGAYVLRRLLALIPTLLIASVIVFGVVRLVPGDVLDLMLSENAYSSNAPDDRAQLEKALGMDKPLYMQYLSWAGNALRGPRDSPSRRHQPLRRGARALAPAVTA